MGWGGQYFLKDYVKSLKTARRIVREPEEAPAVIAEMREYRDEIEGGICVRRSRTPLQIPNSEYFLTTWRWVSRE